jgi:hypothetical protein
MEDKDIFENIPELDVNAEAEMKAIRKTIRNRSWKTVAVSVVLAIAVLSLTLFAFIPAVEMLYWNPDEFTYGHRSDLETTLYAYTELFNPTYNVSRVSYRHFGFASYDLEIGMFANNGQDRQIIGGTLIRDNLELDKSFYDYSTGLYDFSGRRLPDYDSPEWDARVNSEINDHIRHRLEELPDYFLVEAKISFKQDITMEELFALRNKFYLMRVNWIGIRHTAPTNEWTPLCGMSPFGAGSVFDGIYQDYLYFDRSSIREPAQAEQHFKSLLQYSSDQIKVGRGIIHDGNAEFYNEVLNYVEENGVKSYGILVTASPDLLLELMQEDIVEAISFVDIWIDLR